MKAFEAAPGSQIMKASDTDRGSHVEWDVTLDQSEVKMVITQLPDRPGSTAIVFGAFTATCIDTDIVQISSPPGTISLTVVMPEQDQARGREVLQHVAAELVGGEVGAAEPVARFSMVAPDSIPHDGVAENLLTTLAAAQIEVVAICTSRHYFALIVSRERASEAETVIRRALGCERPD